MSATKSQNDAILAHLERGESISPLEALEKYQCFRLAARIHDLRLKGHIIRQETAYTKDGKRFAVYQYGGVDSNLARFVV